MTFGSFARHLSFVGAGFALLATSTPALPQDGNDEARLRRLFDAAEGVPVPLQALPEPLSSPSLADIKKASTLTGGAVS